MRYESRRSKRLEVKDLKDRKWTVQKQKMDDPKTKKMDGLKEKTGRSSGMKEDGPKISNGLIDVGDGFW